MLVGEFLRQEAGSRAEWNCSTLPADWAIECGHPDFAAAWRGIVDEQACAVASEGGLVPLWDQGIGDNLPVVGAPYEPGDIGVVTAHGLEAGALFTGDKWALRMPRGILCASTDAVAVLKAWRP